MVFQKISCKKSVAKKSIGEKTACQNDLAAA
jgi:hypothetical protein